MPHSTEYFPSRKSLLGTPETGSTRSILEQICSEHGYTMTYTNDSLLSFSQAYTAKQLLFKDSAQLVKDTPIYMPGAASCIGGILFLQEEILAFHSDVTAPARLLRDTAQHLPPKQHTYRGFCSSAFPSSPRRYNNAAYYETHLGLYYIPPPNSFLGFEYLIIPKKKELYLTHGKQE